MNENDFVKMVCKSSDANRELEDKVYKQKYVYVKMGSTIKRFNLVSIDMFPYGLFTVGYGKDYKNRLQLKWEDYKKIWGLTKGELEVL